MKFSAKSSISAGLFVLSACLGLGYAEPARAFTLIELVVIPAILVEASQLATITVSNTSGNDVELVATAINDRGAVFKTEGSDANPITLSPNHTFRFSVRAPSTGSLSFHTMIQLNAQNAAFGDGSAWSRNGGQIIAIVPGHVTLPAVQSIPAVQLVASQSALVKVTNVSQNNVSPTINIFTLNGSLLKTATPTIAPNVTFTERVTAPATGNLTFFATITWGDMNEGVSDVMTLDPSTGQVRVILPYVQPGT